MRSASQRAARLRSRPVSRAISEVRVPAPRLRQLALNIREHLFQPFIGSGEIGQRNGRNTSAVFRFERLNLADHRIRIVLRRNAVADEDVRTPPLERFERIANRGDRSAQTRRAAGKRCATSSRPSDPDRARAREARREAATPASASAARRTEPRRRSTRAPGSARGRWRRARPDGFEPRPRPLAFPPARERAPGRRPARRSSGSSIHPPG